MVKLRSGYTYIDYTEINEFYTFFQEKLILYIITNNLLNKNHKFSSLQKKMIKDLKRIILYFQNLNITSNIHIYQHVRNDDDDDEKYYDILEYILINNIFLVDQKYSNRNKYEKYWLCSCIFLKKYKTILVTPVYHKLIIDKNKHTQCILCYNLINTNDKIFKCKYNHNIHANCLIEQLIYNKNTNCSYCKYNFSDKIYSVSMI